jgi:hypothetical protein
MRTKQGRWGAVCAVAGLLLIGGALVAKFQPSSVRDAQTVAQVPEVRVAVRIAGNYPLPPIPAATDAVRVAGNYPLPPIPAATDAVRVAGNYPLPPIPAATDAVRLA